MNATDHERDDQARAMEIDGKLALCGIRRVRVDYFHWRDFRYASLADAVAQAKRSQTKELSNDFSNETSAELGDEMLMQRHAISRRSVDHFLWQDYRYTNAEDAIRASEAASNERQP